MNRYEMEPILNPAGRFAIYGDHLNAIEWMKRIQRERQEERERIYNLLLATNPMDVSICDPIHGDQWIAVALYDLIQPK